MHSFIFCEHRKIIQVYLTIFIYYAWHETINPLMSGGYKRLYVLEAAGLLKYVPIRHTTSRGRPLIVFFCSRRPGL